MNRFRIAAAAACLAAAGAAYGQCPPLETRAAAGAHQKPAFAGQTRACGVQSGVAFDVTVLAKGLAHPWSVEPLPDGHFLVTERPGRMRVVFRDGRVGPPLAGVPRVRAWSQGGLLDIALSPTFATDRRVYWSYSEPRWIRRSATAVARAVLSRDHTALENVEVILRTQPPYGNGHHFGSRLAFGPDGMLYVTTGERYDHDTRGRAQDLGTHWGKTLRVTPDGKPAPGNPFSGTPGALPETWSLGHRNIQSAAFDPQGNYWIVEHGPHGGDELNRIERGANYGWPLVAYGMESDSGKPLANAVTQKPGFTQPVYYWDPSIAPSGAQFYTADAFPAWKGSLFVGSLRQTRLVRLVIENGRVTGEEHMLADRNRRIRDVRQGLDGALYVVTDAPDGELWRIAPRR